MPKIKSPPATAPEPAADIMEPAAGLPTLLLLPQEIGGREGLDPTRYGDWEKNGRCIDF